MSPHSWAEVGLGPRREGGSVVGPLKANTKVKFIKKKKTTKKTWPSRKPVESL